MLFRSQQNLIKTWETLPTELELEKQVGLGGLYQRMAQEEHNSGQRAELLRKSRESLLRSQAEIAHRLQNLESPANGTPGGLP